MVNLAVQGKQVRLNNLWTIGVEIGSGGFGKVHVATANGEECVAKFVPKDPGADRELLFVDLPESPYIVPIIDSGEYDQYWVLVMPRADRSLRQHLEAFSGPVSLSDAIEILRDVCAALVALEGKVVHRDVKPENVLLLDGRWCLADFGISRYAEATTAPDTNKFSMSPPYAAPERWRMERAAPAADVYAVGVMAYEMVAGHRPFDASTREDLREQHLHTEPPHIDDVPAAFGALIDECLYKAPEARPTPANLRIRLDRAAKARSSPGISALEEANRNEVLRRQETARQESEARSESERRAALASAGQKSYEQISEALRHSIEAAAPAAKLSLDAQGGWSIRLGTAEISMEETKRYDREDWGDWSAPVFDVVVAGSVNVRIPADRLQYEGRSHSLWYCDAKQAAQFQWYETAFMISSLVNQRGLQDPFALNPGEAAAKALSNVMAEYQVAWPFTEIPLDDIDEFLDRWADWFAKAAQGELGHPSRMPERDPQGSWRLS